MKKNCHVHMCLRLDRETHDKLFYIAYHEGRSGNGMLLHIVRQSIRDFEKVHGKIKLEQQEEG